MQLFSPSWYCGNTDIHSFGELCSGDQIQKTITEEEGDG